MSYWRARLKEVWPYLVNRDQQRKPATELYPDPVSSKTEEDLPARFRGFLYNDIETCTGCNACKDVCPVQCIDIDVENSSSKYRRWVGHFEIDFGKCISCGLCVEVCEPESLKHTKDFEGARYSERELRVEFGRGFLGGTEAKPNPKDEEE